MRNCIRDLRAKRKMTQDALAKAAHVRRETIVFLEQGKYNPSLLLAHNIARTFGSSIDDVFLFDD